MAMVLASERGFVVDEAARKENIKAALASKNFFEPKDLMKLDEVPGQTMTTGYTLMGLAAENTPATLSPTRWHYGRLQRNSPTGVGTCHRTVHPSSTALLEDRPGVACPPALRTARQAQRV